MAAIFLHLVKTKRNLKKTSTALNFFSMTDLKLTFALNRQNLGFQFHFFYACFPIAIEIL